MLKKQFNRFEMILQRFFDYMSTERYLKGASLLRIGFGLIILYTYILHYSQRHILWSPQGILGEISSPYTLYGISSSPLYFELIFHLGIIFSIVFLMGYGGRVIGLFNYLFTYSFIQHSHLISDGGDNLMYLFLFYLLFANTTAYYSIDSQKYHKKITNHKFTTRVKIENLFHNFAITACVIQVCIVYMASGMYQIMGEMWSSGTAIYYILQVDIFSNPLLRDFILSSDYLLVGAAYSSILIKIAFPFLLINPKTKYFAVACMVTFHLGIGIAMGLITFSLVMITADLIMINDREYSKFFAYIKEKKAKLVNKFISLQRKTVPETHTSASEKIAK